jgi:hypothetical protein
MSELGVGCVVNLVDNVMEVKIMVTYWRFDAGQSV